MSCSFARGRTFQQIPWTTYFERELFLEGPQDGGSPYITYHAYLTSPVGKGPLFVMHHGAGSSGLSFAVLSSEIRKRLPSAGILCPDARGHGSTTTSTTAADTDLSLPTLSSDLRTVIQLTKERMGWPSLPPIVLIGHSLGGAVVTDVASTTTATDGSSSSSLLLGPALLGYAVLDVVEGSAIDALQSMQTYLSGRPARFASIEEGIEWHVRSRTVRNSVSARTSVPPLLVRDDESKGKGEETEDYVIDEEGGGEGDSRREKAQKSANPRPWRWRTDLAATQPFWEGWFVGLSKKFLGGKGGKMLLLAGTDRLDTELTIGQMQGMCDFSISPFFVFTNTPTLV